MAAQTHRLAASRNAWCRVGGVFVLRTGIACAALATEPSNRPPCSVKGESVVLNGRESADLCFSNVVPGSVEVRSTFLPRQRRTAVFVEGRDFVLDAARGAMARVPDSRIPDFAQSRFAAEPEFARSDPFAWDNRPFFAWVDYDVRDPPVLAIQTDQSARLDRAGGKLRDGGSFKIVAFGDSVMRGKGLSLPLRAYPYLYARHLERRFTNAVIALDNAAVGGDTTATALERVDRDVCSKRPDLVLVGLGVNDHMIEPLGVPPAEFERNLIEILRRIAAGTDADIIVVSAAPPHPGWRFGSHRMERYASIMRRVAENAGCGYADAFAVWDLALRRKDPSSLLADNINHPNEFGHILYLEALTAIVF